MWPELLIEKLLKKKLTNEFGEQKAEEIYSNYISARKYLVDEILPEIKRIEKNLTDHGPEHIKNVFQNVQLLLGDDLKKFKSIDLYCLCIIILFHDVGNIWGRKNHHKNISKIFDYVRKDLDAFREEKMIVTTAVRAHTGKSKDGSYDTLKEIFQVGDIFLEGTAVNIRDLAAILRFADELAEGKQRTSNFMIENNLFAKKSIVYQEFSKITKIDIDRPGNRILVSYKINIPNLSKKEIKKFEEILNFCYKRLIKLDQERKFTKHYTTYLSNYKTVSAQFYIYLDNELLNLDLKPIILNDLTVPGEIQKEIVEIDKNYEVKKIIQKIQCKQKIK